MKPIKLLYLLVVLVIIGSFWIYFNNSNSIIKKQVGANIEYEFGNMKITAQEFKNYLEKSNEINPNMLYFYKGQLIKDKNLFQRYCSDKNPIYNYYLNIESCIDLALKTKDINKEKMSLIYALSKIIIFHIDLKRECMYDIKWYEILENK